MGVVRRVSKRGFGSVEPAPAVSVITAAWNALGGLKVTAASVAEQSCQDMEHVIVDGGSTDGTQEWLEGLSGRVRWISEPDNGIADALNKALIVARGEYVLVLQAEDTFLDRNSLARALPHLSGGEDIVTFDVIFKTATRQRRWVSRGLTSALAFKTTIPHQGAFCRRDLFERLGPFDTSFRIAMDYEFFLRARRANVTARVVPEILSRMPDTGISSQIDWPSLRRRFAEERQIQAKHLTGRKMRTVYAVYWPLYLTYRRARITIVAAVKRRHQVLD
jgi:glycosyltransferase involved in cell wall biosynthesis